MNLWHDLPAGEKSAINVVVEINKGSKNKYEVDKATGLIALDRVMHSSQDFPADYGFVPQTLWEDNDPVDVIILTTYPLLPGILVRVRPVAVMHMTDGGEGDDKLIAVPLDDPRWSKVQDLADINSHTLKEFEHFYSTYKKLQNKEVVVKGFSGRTEAEAVFERGCQLYKERPAH
ncbi:MAG: inorganic diphosphatase [Patescibacteria group bacterium]